MELNKQQILNRLSSIQKSKHKTRLGEILEPYLKEINWQNETLDKDIALFYQLATECFKRIGDYDLKKRLDWIKDKNLYPGQVRKLLIK